ncbi:MAG: glycogen/starch/alpha-glucan phosphorylase, partial [Microbacterium sp.]|nr:glycogen/starch/alpha-glucan phosphorylase [Microbacterium sp.]
MTAPESISPRHPLALANVIAPPATVDGFVAEFLLNLAQDRGVSLQDSTVDDRYLALVRTVRGHLAARRLETERAPRDGKTICYLSAEYLLGRQLDNALLATGLADVAAEALAACGVDIAELRAHEIEPGLGNGGLGRLAACYVDSMATLGVPSIGYGIRYEYGIFRQTFQDGQQVEHPDAWMRGGSPWEFPRPERARTIRFGDPDAGWAVRAVPHDFIVPGYLSGAGILRLWSAEALEPLDLPAFNAGDYERAVRAKT